MKYDERFTRDLRLADGHSVRIRLVRADDKARLRAGFDELSVASRQRRFFGGKHYLSDDELRYLTELDQLDHVAVGVVELDAAGNEGAGIGIARFIRLPDDRGCAEVALTVVDRMQGQGVGRQLLRHLTEAALERDVERFRFECLPYNHEMRRLVEKTCHIVEYANDSEVLVAEVALPGCRAGSPTRTLEAFDELFTVLRAHAAQAVRYQIRSGFDTMRRSLGRQYFWTRGERDRALRGPAD